MWRYVYRAVDQHGQVIDVLLSARRDGIFIVVAGLVPGAGDLVLWADGTLVSEVDGERVAFVAGFAAGGGRAARHGVRASAAYPDAAASRLADPADLAEAISADTTAVAHHLRFLKDARLIRRQRRGRHVFYALHSEATTRLIVDVLRYAEKLRLRPAARLVRSARIVLPAADSRVDRAFVSVLGSA